ncbi:MAG: hypothetical protein WC943_06225 [Elusimicrobiota bacterium]
MSPGRRTLGGAGIGFQPDGRRCVVTDEEWIGGAVFLGVGLFSSYILFFRPDIHGSVTPLIWLFRVIFPFGFGFAGLAMLGSWTRTEFDAGLGRFRRTGVRFFKPSVLEGHLSVVKRLVLKAWQETDSDSDSGNQYQVWKFKLSMDLGIKTFLLSRWSWRPEGRQPQNDAVVEAKEEAGRLASLIGCPLSFQPLGDRQA